MTPARLPRVKLLSAEPTLHAVPSRGLLRRFVVRPRCRRGDLGAGFAALVEQVLRVVALVLCGDAVGVLGEIGIEAADGLVVLAGCAERARGGELVSLGHGRGDLFLRD